MDLRKIKKLIELVEESGITELEVKSGEEAVRIARPTPGGVAELIRPTAAEPLVPVPPAIVGLSVRAPMAGTFYCAPSPEADPFVAVGEQVEMGQVLCIIESMKMMNQIEADTAGTVLAVMVSNETPVETGQPLFSIG